MLLSKIIKVLDLDNKIKDDYEIQKINTLQDASNDEISFLENQKYLSSLMTTKAKAVLINQAFASQVPKGVIALVVDEPYIALAKLSKYFAKSPISAKKNKPITGDNCFIDENVSIGNNVKIGDNVTIMSGVVLLDNVQIGNNVILYPNVTIYHNCILGDDVILHAGVVIGADGFGFATTKEGKHIKIYQNGNVVIGNDVEIGANTTIDRAVFNSTTIGDGVRLDNLIMVAHNVTIKKGSVIAGQCGIAGSTTLEPFVVCGAQSGITGHITIAQGTIISARSGATKSIKEPNIHWAGFPLFRYKTWLKLQAKISKLL